MKTTQNFFDSACIEQGLLREFRVALLELIDASFGIDHGLLAGEVRMAGGACVDGHLLLGGARLDDVAASAGDGSLAV